MYKEFNYTYFKPSYNQRFQLVGVTQVNQSGIANSGLWSQRETLITLKQLGAMI